jgi:hypothetical protein
MTTNQRLKRLERLERKIESSFMPSYRKVKKILQENRYRALVKSSSNNKVSLCPWNDLCLNNETVEGYII